MNKYFVGIVAVLALAVGGIAMTSHSSKTTVTTAPVVQQEPVLGAAASPDHYNYEQFFVGEGSSKYAVISPVSASSSSTTAANIYLALGASSAGQLTIGTSTPGTRVVNASTTAITSPSDLVLVFSRSTTTIPGVTCNATAPTSTILSSIFASSTNTGLNGFQLTAGSIPTTNPNCYEYLIVPKLP